MSWLSTHLRKRAATDPGFETDSSGNTQIVESLVRWWLTKPKNWTAAVLFLVINAALVGGAWALHASTGGWGGAVTVFLIGLVVEAVVFVLVPLALGAHYGIEPYVRGQDD